ncbi:hypothetical protein ElyMa_004076100 [Elysia marginata]|uniref:Uncharacterized protein n=1 Tax=Elysia marginata TaxID=1093978 RepID=A0AAV4G8P1_9GAST|nr:hypothetical protein ElyMa_004076100 [Elysia marginata]
MKEQIGVVVVQAQTPKHHRVRYGRPSGLKLVWFLQYSWLCFLSKRNSVQQNHRLTKTGGDCESRCVQIFDIAKTCVGSSAWLWPLAFERTFTFVLGCGCGCVRRWGRDRGRCWSWGLVDRSDGQEMLQWTEVTVKRCYSGQK